MENDEVVSCPKELNLRTKEWWQTLIHELTNDLFKEGFSAEDIVKQIVVFVKKLIRTEKERDFQAVEEASFLNKLTDNKFLNDFINTIIDEENLLFNNQKMKENLFSCCGKPKKNPNKASKPY